MCQNFPRVSTSPLFQSFEWLHIRVDTMICTVIDVCLNNDLLLNFIWWWCYKICSLVWWTLIKSNTVRLNSWTKNDSYICVKLKGHIIKYQLNWNIGIWIDPPILFTSCPGGWLTCDLPVTICMLCACVPLLLAGSCVWVAAYSNINLIHAIYKGWLRCKGDITKLWNQQHFDSWRMHVWLFLVVFSSRKN